MMNLMMNLMNLVGAEFGRKTTNGLEILGKKVEIL